VSKYDNGPYHWVWYRENHGGHHEFTDMLVDFFPDLGTLVDIGCGDGLNSSLLAQKGFEVTGYDIDKTAIKFANRFSAKMEVDVKFEAKGFEDMPNKKYDYCLCHAVIEHVKNPKALLKKIRRVTKRYAIIGTDNGEFVELSEHDRQMWGWPEFGEFMEDNGFKTKLAYLDEDLIIARGI
jgi:SAM-dependent methyltransferase